MEVLERINSYFLLGMIGGEESLSLVSQQKP